MFLVKDVFRDRYKELSDRVDAANSLYLVRQDIGIVGQDVADLTKLVMEGNDEIYAISAKQRRPHDESNSISVESQQQYLDRTLYSILKKIETNRRVIYQVQDLANKIGEGAAFMSKANLIQMQMDKIQGEATWTKEDAEDVGFGENNAKAVDELSKDTSGEEGELEAVNRDLTSAFALVYANAVDEGRVRESHYMPCEHLSWFLYGLGWSLAALGALFDMEGIEIA